MASNKKFVGTGELFSDAVYRDRASHVTWTPEAPPSLDGISNVFLNVETTGLRWWKKDRPVGISVCLPDGSTRYLPFGHRGGGNLDEETVKRWAQRELRGKHITNLNTRFDIHQLREWGVNLEEQGNTVSDVGHYAALLDDHRQRFNLDSLIRDYLEHEPLPRVDESRMADYHAGEVAPRAEYNAQAVRLLRDTMWPLLDAQNLQRVRALEDKVIYPVCEMERNGSPIDVELLTKWNEETEQLYLRCLWDIHRETGLKVNPDSPKDMTQLFTKLGIPFPRTDKGNPSFPSVFLKSVEHPTVQMALKALRLGLLRSKYIVKGMKTVSSDGILRYALHQLRTEKDKWDEHGAGTVTGRFSSTEIYNYEREHEGDNIQQRMKVAKQRVQWGYDENDSSHDDEIFLVRQLHKPADPNHLFLSADAMQVEYRMFACYAGTPSIIKAYEENPLLSFHKHVWEMIKPYKELTYRRQKDLNFAKIYGAGLKKLALMLEFITEQQWAQLHHEKASNDHPLLREAKQVEDIYNRVLPEVRPLLRKASHLAMPCCSEWCRQGDELHRLYPHRGYVTDLVGRRSRFPDGYRIHKALNSVIQPGAASILKQKLVELHDERKWTGFILRFPVHDEVDGDVPDLESARRVEEVLNRQSFPELKIPILFEVKTGKNWRHVKNIDSDFNDPVRLREWLKKVRTVNETI